MDLVKGSLAGRELAGQVVGIVGTGAIGIRTAAIFKAFGLNLLVLIGVKRKPQPRLLDSVYAAHRCHGEHEYYFDPHSFDTRN